MILIIVIIAILVLLIGAAVLFVLSRNKNITYKTDYRVSKHSKTMTEIDFVNYLEKELIQALKDKKLGIKHYYSITEPTVDTMMLVKLMMNVKRVLVFNTNDRGFTLTVCDGL